MQILPAIDLRDGKCVRLRQGDYAQETVFDDDPVETARRWVDAGAERLHLVDLDGARAGRPVNDAVIRRIIDATKIPCQMGGGVRDEASARRMLDEVGVDRVIIGTQALRRPDWFRDLTQALPHRVALGLDARNGRVATQGWLEVSEVSALELARSSVGLPLAAVIYTNIANDGMMQGIDPGTLADMERLADMGLPVIASGGVTTLDDVRRLTEIHARQPRLIGAIIGRALYEGTIGVAEAIAVGRGGVV